jgi:chromosome partitioning protein
VANIYVITSLKAGSGKTTIAMHLCEYLKHNHRTMLLDADLTTDHFEWALQQDKNLAFEHLDIAENDATTLDQRMQHLIKQYERIVVDIDGHDSKALRSVLKHADKMIIPTGIGEQDLSLLKEMVELAIAMKQYNPQLRVYVLLNKIPMHTEVQAIEQANQLLGNIPGMRFLNTIVYDDSSFAQAMQASRCIGKAHTQQAEQMDQVLVDLLAD